MLEHKDQDIKLSTDVTHHHQAVASLPSAPTSNRSSIDHEPTNWKKQAAGGRSRGKKKDLLSEERVRPTDLLESISPPSNCEEVVPDQSTNLAFGSVVNNVIDDDHAEQNRLGMDENSTPSPIFAAELVQDDEEARGVVLPGGNLWEEKVQEEFQTRLLTLEQNLVVAEVVTKQSSDTRQRWMIGGLLLTLVSLAGAIGAGVATANKNKQVEDRGQKQVRFRKELSQLLNRTHSDKYLTPLEDPMSPQSRALEWLLKDGITLTENSVTQKVLDRYVLAVLYYATNGPQWENDVGSYFLLEREVCDWNTGVHWSSSRIVPRDPNAYEYIRKEPQNETVGGVYCQGSESRIRLSLNYCGLKGTLPSELSLLSNVVSIQVTGNALEGTLPPELSKLSTLLDLAASINLLTGTLPTELGLLTELQDFDVFDNVLTGTLPTELDLLTELHAFYVWYNLLTGTLPTALGLLTELQYFYVIYNMLTGTLPTELGQLTKLQDFDVCYNSLIGTLPTELGLLTELQYFDVLYNMLTGTLPKELGQLTELQYFFVGNNSFTGTLPTELGLLTELQDFFVGNNMLTGTLSTELGQLTELQDFFVGNNSLTGSLPTELGLLTACESLWLGYNKFMGTLPTELGRLTALSGLKCHDNALTGTMPTEMGMLINLERLYMENNKLTGPLPTELGRLTGLYEFRIFNNFLTGTLPTEMDQMVSLGLLDLSNNLFTGTVPSNFAENLGTNFLFDGNNFTGNNFTAGN